MPVPADHGSALPVLRPDAILAGDDAPAPPSLIAALWLAVDDGAEARMRRCDPRLRMALAGAWIAVWVWRLYRGEAAPVGSERAAGLKP